MPLNSTGARLTQAVQSVLVKWCLSSTWFFYAFMKHTYWYTNFLFVHLLICFIHSEVCYLFLELIYWFIHFCAKVLHSSTYGKDIVWGAYICRCISWLHSQFLRNKISDFSYSNEYRLRTTSHSKICSTCCFWMCSKQ